MTFDSTISAIVIPDMAATGSAAASNGKRQWRIAFQVAPSTMDLDDFQALYADSIGAPWMGMYGVTANIVANALYTFDLTGGIPQRLRAKRRFRENDSTLWMIYQNLSASGADFALALDGMVRTLIHIP